VAFEVYVVCHSYVFILSAAYLLFGEDGLGLIPEEHKPHLKEELQAGLKDSVRVVLFTQEFECEFCKESRELVTEVAELAPDKIKTEIYDFVKDADKVKEFNIDKVPAIVILGSKDYGIRYFGIPYGYEFNSFIDNIVNVSKGTTNLSEETKKKLASIEKPVHIQVFVTLTCPYCPIAAGLAHKFALESDKVRADVIEAGEFPHLAQKYAVMGVPKIVINERTELVGAVPENQFVDAVVQAQKTPSIYM
jgi:glutaredoxin-like protein